MRKQKDISEQDFEGLLSWLDADRDAAGKKYEEIRHSLIKIFTWRRVPDAQELADETINRVARKVGSVAETYSGDKALYFYGVAKKVLQEFFRDSSARRPPPPPPAEKDENYERVHDCLDRCIERLPPQNRELVLMYYRKEKQSKIDFRKEIARQTKTDLNTLRVRMHRLRATLQKCILECLERQGVR